MKNKEYFLILFMVIAGCSGQRLAMLDAEVDPAKPSPGDELILKVKVIDTENVVARVAAYVREAPDMSIELNDKGEKGDTTPGDGTWTAAFKVPRNAPSGIYNCDFEAFDAIGKRLKVKSEENIEKSLTAEVSVEVVR